MQACRLLEHSTVSGVSLAEPWCWSAARRSSRWNRRRRPHPRTARSPSSTVERSSRGSSTPTCTSAATVDRGPWTGSPKLGDIEIDAIVATSLAAQLASGVTAVRDLGDARWTVVDRHRAHPQGPTVGRSGPPITCVNGHCAGMGGEASGEDGLRRAVRRLELPGCDDVDGGALILEHDDLTGWHVEPGAIARERGDGSLPRPGSARFLSVVCHSARWPFPGSVRARSGSRGRPR
jgi:hypothetical protein